MKGDFIAKWIVAFIIFGFGLFLLIQGTVIPLYKSKRNTYCGYWDYEAAAVAKILNMNSSELQKLEYFPYDLVR